MLSLPMSGKDNRWLMLKVFCLPGGGIGLISGCSFFFLSPGKRSRLIISGRHNLRDNRTVIVSKPGNSKGVR